MTLEEHLLTCFAGREDTYASGTERGFAPVRSPLTADVIRDQHVAGRRAIGFYLMRSDNMVRCACVDFDNKPNDPDPEWWKKAVAVKGCLAGRGVGALLEISQSGNAAHVWVFLSEWTPARDVRAFLTDVSKGCGITLREVYPRQDTLKPDGLGNLVRLPLWNKSRFVDDERNTIDPLVALSSIERVTADKLIVTQEATPKIDGLSDRVAQLVTKRGTLLAKRWAGKTEGLKDTTDSAIALSIAACLVRAYVPTHEIEEALRYWLRSRGNDKGDRGDWLKRTIDAAYQSAKPQSNEAHQIVEQAADYGDKFYRSATDDEIYVVCKIRGHAETLPIDDERYEYVRRVRYAAKNKKVISREALKNSVLQLKATAYESAPARDVFLRVGSHGDKVYLDLCDTERRVVEIDRAGWRVVADCPVLFRRPATMQALPVPERGGSLAELWDLLHVANEDRALLAGAMAMGFNPQGPYPLIWFVSRAGSGKTTAAKMIQRLIDPSAVVGSAEPKKTEDVMVAASNRWLLYVDNVSNITTEISDCLCRLSTGGAMTRRRLYSDREETSFVAQRPVVITSIQDVLKRTDLIDRALRIELEPLVKRLDEREIERRFHAMQPRVLGVLLDGVVSALSSHKTVDNAPRMAAFAEWSHRAEGGMGLADGSFMQAYTTNQMGLSEMALDDDLAEAVTDLVKDKPFVGTASQLAGQIGKPTAEARQLSATLRDMAPMLENRGIMVKWSRTGRKRNIEIALAV